ncbi:MAG: class I SAM-dependent methyltransferase [Frankiaceae bacterium]|nr:class I SAM-dependent methyltransferase [Frankiaceae bacterium]
MTDAASNWATVFSHVFREPESSVSARIWAQALGDEYPAEVAPYSYTSRTELTRIAGDVALSPGGLLVDVGSGRGGPGLWVASATEARYLAVDITADGLAEVERRAAGLGLGDRTRVAVGSFEATPLADDEADAIMSIDALLFTPDKGAALRELARVLRPGGRLVLTTWDYTGQPVGRPPQVPDHRPLVAAAGLDLVAYDETPDWRRRQSEINRLLMEAADELAAESGEPVDEVRAGIAEMAATNELMIRRVLLVAEKP